MRRIPDRPPPMSFFASPRAAGGAGRFDVRFGSLHIALEGVGTDLVKALAARYEPYRAGEADGPMGLRVRVARDDVDYFIEPPARAEPNPVLLECDGSTVRFLGYRAAGWFDTVDRRGGLLLGRGAYESLGGAVENYIRAAVAWLAVTRGGALVHAASAVRDGRAYLFYGESGAGKSTLAQCNRSATVVSDDLSLVLPRPGAGLELVGTPFRGTYEGGGPVQGTFPLHAGFRIVQDTQAMVRQVPRALALAELIGNLPFVAEAFPRRPDLFESIERAFEGIPLAHLHFRKDDTYWDAIDRALG